ncbi:PREDICTED: adhesion G protein-coupled receptor E1 [Chinchilla lanigera]|uniref:adhesion G protein-coupled receptor E1 n=1 Tax=Chinchilla lanigera TaxID=34839 RepID=UPI00069737F2|nr:PREDICTED: adhesion G protein-coupled receptor E1 [Chinchilla lanigera]
MRGCSLLLLWDENECLDTTTCPAYSTCHNTAGSYYCTCKQGFLATNGQSRFNSPGVQCADVDECSQSPPACGPHSVCMNLPGRYSCSCFPGFSSPTGNGWRPGKPGRFACTDIDECLSSGVCPDHALCTNFPGSYNCSCQAGFIADGAVCEDIDECLSSGICPEYTDCVNTLGNYSCLCQPGFMPWGSACKDINECLLAGLCPEHADCINSLGNYSCRCQAGFTSRGSVCEDIDECVDSCPLNSTCTNTLGSYFCTCHSGFAPSNGQLNFTGQEVGCEDVDECSQDPSPCGPHSVCTNVPGSYSCGCSPGFRPSPEGSETHGNFSCRRVPFKCREDMIPHNEQVQHCQEGSAVDPKYVSFCGLVNATFSVLDDTCENKSAPVSLERKVETFDSVLEQTSTWTKFTQEEKSTLATVLLESVESTTLAALLTSSENTSQAVHTKHLDIESKVINDDECNKENVSFLLKAKGDAMTVGCSTIEESESTGTTGVAFVSFANMESVLDERFFADPQAHWGTMERKLRMNSRVVGGIMTGQRRDNFTEPVIYTLENIQPKHKLEKAICVSWNTDIEDGRWTPSGCVTLTESETHTTCSCNHMANLAVIMASGELTMEFSLYVISHVGMIISLVCLLLAIATFLLCHAIRNHNTYLHLHLCVCLFLAKFLFLTGIDKTNNQTGCAIIAGFLHYLFLACFFWMLVEAVMLFLMVRNLKVVNYFSSRNIKMLHLCAFGYGLPGLVVTISAGVQPQGYGMHNRCWLNTETGFIWSFLGPVCTIIAINSVLLSWTLWILRQKLCSVNTEVSTLKDSRLLTFKAFAQLFILGCTWVLGIFQVGPIAGIMAYLFTIVNSLQGAFIFLIHCLLNRQVREEYRRWITRKTKPSSQPQTSGMLLSSTPSTSKTAKDCMSSTDSAHKECLSCSNTQYAQVSWEVSVRTCVTSLSQVWGWSQAAQS